MAEKNDPLDGIAERIKERSAVEAPPASDPDTELNSGGASWTYIQTDWQRLKGRIHGQWPLLSDNEIDATEGDRDRFVAAVQERYGLEAKVAEEQVDIWARSLGRPDENA